jgi:hypothetical protein
MQQQQQQQQQRQLRRRNNNNNKSFTFIDAARMIGQRDEEEKKKTGTGICSLVCHPDYCHAYLYPGLAMAAITPAAAAEAAAVVAVDDINNDDNNDNNNNNKVSSYYYSKYWRYDTVGPAYTNPRTIYFSSSIPDTKRIPPTRFHDIETYLSERYDEMMLKQQQQQQQQGLKQSSSVISLGTFVEYNPSIVQIPYHMLANLPDGTTYLLSARITSANNCFHESMYTNVSSYIRDAMYYTNRNYLGLALLNEQLHVVTNVRTGTKYEIVIDLERNLGLHRTSTAGGGGPVFMDYRLFVLNDNIYLHANMDTVVVSRLSLSTSSSSSSSSSNNSSSRSGTKNENNSTQDVIRECADIALEYGDKCWDSACRLQNLYSGSSSSNNNNNSNDNSDYDDDGLQVTLMRQFNTIWSGGKGKNYALFAIPKTNNNNNNTTTKNHREEEDVYAEIHIFPHHQVQQILPDTHDIITKRTLWERLWFPGTKKSRKCNIDCLNLRQVREVGNITISNNEESSNGSSSTSMVLQPSYYTIDAHEDWFPGSAAPFKESAHGGACCVHFTPSELNIGGSKTNHTQSLLVGVGHTKVTWKPWYSNAKTSQAQKDRIPHTHYVSLFYAFDNYPPFTVRAKSGYFCLGHAALLFNTTTTTTTTNDDEGDYNPYSTLTRNRPLRQNNVTFDCPQISFISSFIEKKKKKEEMRDDDTTLSSSKSSSTIIGYGLNDCTGRLVEVKKSEIMRLLYPDPMDMLFEVVH